MSTDVLATQPTSADIIKALVEIARRFQPYLDPGGTVYCRLPCGRNGTAHVVMPLKDDRVRDMMIYLFQMDHDSHIPAQREVAKALSFIQGQLWHEYNPDAAMSPPVVQAIVKVWEKHRHWQGSTSELLPILVETVRRHPDMGRAEDLPQSEDSLGTQLARNRLLLAQHGIDLYRPPRTEQQRRWAWRSVDNPDTSDTLTVDVSCHNRRLQTDIAHPDASDTLTEEQNELLAIYNKPSGAK